MLEGCRGPWLSAGPNDVETENISNSSESESIHCDGLLSLMPLKLENVEVDVAFQVSHLLLKCQSCK